MFDEKAVLPMIAARCVPSHACAGVDIVVMEVGLEVKVEPEVEAPFA